MTHPAVLLKYVASMGSSASAELWSFVGALEDERDEESSESSTISADDEDSSGAEASGESADADESSGGRFFGPSRKAMTLANSAQSSSTRVWNTASISQQKISHAR